MLTVVYKFLSMIILMLIFSPPVGIVGIPNVGKSTFFNVLTKSQAQAENLAHLILKLGILITCTNSHKFESIFRSQTNLQIVK